MQFVVRRGSEEKPWTVTKPIKMMNMLMLVIKDDDMFYKHII